MKNRALPKSLAHAALASGPALTYEAGRTKSVSESA